MNHITIEYSNIKDLTKKLKAHVEALEPTTIIEHTAAPIQLDPVVQKTVEPVVEKHVEIKEVKFIEPTSVPTVTTPPAKIEEIVEPMEVEKVEKAETPVKVETKTEFITRLKIVLKSDNSKVAEYCHIIQKHGINGKLTEEMLTDELHQELLIFIGK